MPKMDVVAAVAIAIAVSYLWTRWDEHLKLRRERVEQRPTGAAGGRKDQ
jgi:hypothetical protein